MIPYSVFASSFKDVDEYNENYTAIEYLKTNGIINGYEDQTFRPDNLVNRAEAVKILIEAFKISANNSGSSFSDVSKNDWFYEYVLTGKNSGIINGYGDGSFKPSNTIILAEALKIVTLSASFSVENPIENVFVDVANDAWYSPYAYFAREKNLILADNDGSIGIGDEMSRSEFAEIIYRMMKVKELNGEAFDLSENWDFYQSAYFPIKMKFDSKQWKVYESEFELGFLNKDLLFDFSSADRVYSDSAKIVFSIDKNDSGRSQASYFANLRENFPTWSYTEFQFRGLPAVELMKGNEGKADWYVYLGDGRVLGIFTEYGNGVLKFQYPKLIFSMLKTIEYSPNIGSLAVQTKSDILSEIYGKLLIENQGLSMLNKLPDKIIIETDTIGVGTGPVDYYYTEEWDITFKYERNSDLILDKRDGRTTAF